MTTIYIILLCVTAGYGFFHFRQLQTALQILTVFVLVVLVTQMVDLYCIDTIGTNYPVLQVFTYVGIVFNGFIYYSILKKDNLKRRVVIVISLIALMLLILNWIFYEGLFDFPSNGLIINAFQIVIFVFLTYVSLLNESRKRAIYSQSIFWLNSGNFLFYGISFFIFAFFNYIYKDSDARWIYDLLKYANYAMYIFFFMAIHLNKKEEHEL